MQSFQQFRTLTAVLPCYNVPGSLFRHQWTTDKSIYMYESWHLVELIVVHCHSLLRHKASRIVSEIQSRIEQNQHMNA